MQYIHQSKSWPFFTWNNAILAANLAEAKFQQGLLLGRMQNLDTASALEAEQQILQSDALASSALEGIKLAKSRLGKPDAACAANEHGEQEIPDKKLASEQPQQAGQPCGAYSVLLDALHNQDKLLTAARLEEWNARMRSGSGKHGARQDEQPAERKVSNTIIQCGLLANESFAYSPPPKEQAQRETSAFLAWYNYGNLPGASMSGGLQTQGNNAETEAVARLWREPLLRAGIAHLWLMAIQPHPEATGRIARAATDMLLHRADGYSKRFYSLSDCLLKEREAYQTKLRAALLGGQDITAWLEWFLHMLAAAMTQTQELLNSVIRRADLRRQAACSPLNERQRAVFEAMLDGQFKKMNTGVYAKLVNSSPDSALRDMQEMIDFGLMRKNSAGGRSTSYSLKR